MPTKKYSFYESDPILQDLYDELVRNRDLTPTIHRLAINGLGKDINKAQKDLKRRMSSMKKVDQLYKKIQIKEREQLETIYNKYKGYRKNLIDGETAYEHSVGLEWIEKHAKKLGVNKKNLLEDLEFRFGEEEKNGVHFL